MIKKLMLNQKNSFIPVNTPKIFKQDKINVKDCLNKGWISSEGNYVKKFEKDFAKYINKKYGVAVANGTAALEIALKSLNLKKKDEVIIPTFSIISTALCVVKLGLKPVLVDCDVENWNMKIDEVISKINKKTKAIIITHIYGFPVSLKKILKIAKKRKIRIIEDSAEMIGQEIYGKKCGSFGDISTFSFYANKHITTGEGGMILTNDSKIYNKCKSLRNLCFGKNNADRFNHDDIGWNYRFSNLQAALGCGQLKNIKWIIKRKREIGKRYYNKLKNNKKIYIQPLSNKFSKNIFWVFGILIKKKLKLDNKRLMKELLKKNIQTRGFFWPMHKQKIFKKLKLFKNQKYPNAEFLSKKGLYLPSGLGITNKQIDYVSKTTNELINKYS
tara:strand:+ start:3083 stop:4243 length:1161 start_codon:yes stop_codon:yes gene_type:complete